MNVDKTVHRVQVLDVATGTGTFLASVVSHIHNKFEGQKGLWSSYVEEHLIPRIHGFELLMASYAMCHMKLEILLQETGYKPKNGGTPPRLNVYLTNSLQKADEEVDKLPLIEWFSRESNEASYIKKNSPIMVAIGNPPYRGISSNKGELIVDIEDYKYVDGVHFGERKHWLHDDYVKFIRLGEHFIEKNGEGVVGYITNHGYLDNPTFRGMRWHLLRTFSDIYVLDLHGSTNKKEKNPSGAADENVFDIKPGVSILIAVKKTGSSKKELANVHHADLWGTREHKYDYLHKHRLKDIKWTPIVHSAPAYYFVPRNTAGKEEFKKGFGIEELFVANGAGIVTARDEFVIDIDQAALFKRMSKAAKMGVEEAREYYQLRNDVESWQVSSALNDLKATGPNKSYIKPIAYRPFDNRFIYYTDISGGILARPNGRIMQHMIGGDNVAIVAPKQAHGSIGAWVTKTLTAHKVFEAYNINTIFPLYTISDGALLDAKVPNLDKKIWEKIRKTGGKRASDPQAVFDYVYASVHALSYNGAFKELLKSSFPRVPYPVDAKRFEALATLGAKLRQLHFLESPDCIPPQDMAAYPVDGSHKVERVKYADEKVWINETQYFEGIPEEVWERRIGGFQPADKWLKDRKERILTFDDIVHYQKIIGTISATLDVLIEIEEVYSS